MNAKLERSCWLLLAALVAVSCGGGGGGGSPAVAIATLVSIALTPLTVSLAPGGTQQLTVTGTYNNGSTQALAASGETFTSSSPSVATVSATGLVTVLANATAASTATITATDTASSLTSATANATVVTVTAAAAGPPSPNSVAAATATANDNALCTAITPFYWEIGNMNGALASASLGTQADGTPVLATTKLSIASASKWVYGTYVVQMNGSATVAAQDVPFMNFTSGYTNMGGDVTGAECPNTDSPDTINTCLALPNPSNGLPYSYQNPATVGTFNYDAGHLENYASLKGNLGNVDVAALGPMIGSALGANINLVYTEALLAGGIVTSSNDYAQILRNILSGSLFMQSALGTNSVCTAPSAPGCNATFTPIPEAWHYSIAHWVEDDPTTNGDAAFSSPGAFGFYPWIAASKNYYGIISREELSGMGIQNGYASAQCGRLIRKAWDTGVQQSGEIPQ